MSFNLTKEAINKISDYASAKAFLSSFSTPSLATTPSGQTFDFISGWSTFLENAPKSNGWREMKEIFMEIYNHNADVIEESLGNE
jgi:hypothetical protein